MKKRVIITVATMLLGISVNAQTKDGLFLVNEKQKKIFFNYGQSAGKAWYTIGEKVKDTVLQQSFIVDKGKMTAALDSLKKAEYLPKFKKQSVADLNVSLTIAEHKFYKTDSIKKAPGKVTVDSIFIVKVTAKISSEKEKINKTRYFDQKYTTLNRVKLEEKLKKYKDYSLVKYGTTDIYELQLLFVKTMMLNPLSFYASFDLNEIQYF